METERIKPTKPANFISDIAAWMVWSAAAGGLAAYGGGRIWLEFFYANLRLLLPFALLVAGLVALGVMLWRSRMYDELLFHVEIRRQIDQVPPALNPEEQIAIRPEVITNDGKTRLLGSSIFDQFTLARWKAIAQAVANETVLNSSVARTIKHGNSAAFPNCAANWASVYSPELRRLGFLDKDEHITPLLRQFLAAVCNPQQTTTTTTPTTAPTTAWASTPPLKGAVYIRRRY